MKVEINMTLEVEDNSNLVSLVEDAMLEDIMVWVSDAIYDIDDVRIKEMEAKRAD